MRTSTVPKEWCGRTLHHSWVCSTIELVRTSRSTYSAHAAQPPNGSGTPQRGKLLVKICERTDCRPESRPSRNTEFADSASSSGRTGRSRSHTATARSAPRTPTCTWRLKVLLRQATYLRPSSTRW